MSRAQEVVEMCHQKAHLASSDPEDYILVSLTQQEVFLVLMGMVMASVYFNCLEDPATSLIHKIGGSVHHAKPEWRGEIET